MQSHMVFIVFMPQSLRNLQSASLPGDPKKMLSELRPGPRAKCQSEVFFKKKVYVNQLANKLNNYHLIIGHL